MSQEFFTKSSERNLKIAKRKKSDVKLEFLLKRTVECVENFTYSSGSCVPCPERGYKNGIGNHACVILPGKRTVFTN